MKKDESGRKENVSKELTVGLVFGWIFGILFLISSVNNLVKFHIISSLFLFIIFLSIFPPLNKLYSEKFDFRLSFSLKVLILIVCLFFTIYFGIHDEYEKDKAALSDYSEYLKYNIINNFSKNNSSSSSTKVPSSTSLEYIFNSPKYKEALTISKNKLNCNLSQNYGKSLMSFKVNYRCRQEEEGATILVGEEDCSFFGGKSVPQMSTRSYPSLSEYHFENIVYEILNGGCTKINYDDYKIIYALYRGNSLIKIKTMNEIIGTPMMNSGKILYPEDYLFVWLSFSETGPYANPLILKNSDNFVFKSCILSDQSEILACDELNFNF